MSKKINRTGFRVEVEPRHPGSLFLGWVTETEDECEARCAEIARQIKRHVDDVGRIDVVWDEEAECEHCGSRWTEGDLPHNGGCCDEDTKRLESYEKEQKHEEAV